MSFRNRIIAIATLAMGLAGASAAIAATASTSLNVRSGPGNGNRVVDVLHEGERVQVIRCTSSGRWCEIGHRGPDGWVYASYLDNIDRRDRDYGGGSGSGGSSSDDEDDVNFEISFGIGDDGRPDFNFSVGQGANEDPGLDRPAGNGSVVCFFEDYGFRGASFCSERYAADREMGPIWNDRISSIRVAPGASVVVCEDWNYNGRCAVIRNDVSQLSGPNNDIISSYRVR